MTYEKPSVSQTRSIKDENTGNRNQSLMMSQYSYVQLVLVGLFFTGAISAENATCTNLRAQSNVDINQVYGDWFLAKAYGINVIEDKRQCYQTSLKTVDDTTFKLTTEFPTREMSDTFTIENAEHAGTWKVVGEDRTVQVIYLSADGTIMAIAECMSNQEEPVCILLSKQLPISSGKVEEVLHAVEHSGMSGHHHHFTWESEATCPSA